jgi:hypothetical protein
VFGRAFGKLERPLRFSNEPPKFPERLWSAEEVLRILRRGFAVL